MVILMFNFKYRKIFIILISIVFIILGIKNLGLIFDITTEPQSADIIVSLGGDNGNRIKKTLELYENNISTSHKIIVTGVDNFDPTMKADELDWRASYLIKKGVKSHNIVFNSDAKNTFEEMKFIKNYMIEHNMTHVMVVTDPPHSRRIAFFSNTVLKYPASNLHLQIIGSENDWWNAESYYTNAEAIIFVINESIKYTYYYLQYLLGTLHE